MWILILLLGLFFNIPQVQAKSYTISPVNITETVLKDGSMKVEETRTFNFEGNFTFAYQYINKHGQRTEPYILSNFKICDELTCFKQSSIDTNIPNTFFLREESNRYYFKWFYSASNQSKTFKLSYDVTNAVTLQSDTAEIYWQAIGKDWEIEQKNITVKFLLPMGIDGSKIQAWAHGPTNGTVSIPSSNEITLKVNTLPIKTFFEGRILVPKETFINGVKGNLSKSEIINEENKFIADTKQNNKFNLFKFIIGLVIVIGLFAWQLIIFIKKIKLYKKYGKDKKIEDVTLSGRWWEPPSDIDPVQVEQLMSGSEIVTANGFTATILSLVVDRFYKINRSDKKEGIIFRNYKYFLVAIEKNTKNPSSIQKSVIEILEKINEEMGEIDLGKMSVWFRKHSIESQTFLTKTLPGLATKENLVEGYFDLTSDIVKNKYLTIEVFLPLIFSFLAIFLLANLNFLAVLLLPLNVAFGIIVVVVISMFKLFAEKLTNKGREEATKWIGFKKHLKEYNQTVKDPVDSVIIWEKYLVYGTVLGVSVKALSQMPVNFSQQDQIILASYWGGGNVSGGITDINGTISSINEAMQSISTSINSSYGASGAGSSGSSSGGGGGGGGGAG